MDLTFFPALAEYTVLVQRNWLSWGVFHWPHPEDSVCWAHTDACSVGDASLWIEDECLTPLPSFHWLDSQYIWTKSSADLYAECTANTSLLIDVRKYSNWHLLIH